MANVSRSLISVEEDITFQRRSWRVKRIAWGVMALIVAAALAGLFGNGPLSKTTTADQSGLLRAEISRFQRNSTPAEMRLHVAQSATAGDHVEIELRRSFLDTFSVELAGPLPLRTFVRASGLSLVFQIKPGETASVRPLTERLRMARISEDDILAAARTQRGLGRMEQIRFAVLEVNGKISVIPQEPPYD